jgi:hypothetical protein
LRSPGHVSPAQQRLIGALGVAYVALTIGPAFFVPPPPPGGAALVDIVNYYTSHRSALLVAGWTGLLAFPVGFGFFAGQLLTLRGEDATSRWLTWTALLSIGATLSVAAMQGILALAVPYVAGTATPSELKLLADVTQVGFSATFPLEIAYFAAVGLLGLRSGAIPRWLAYGAFLVVAAAVLASFGIIARTGPLAAGGQVTLVALVAGLLWWLLVSLLLLVRPTSGS